jgi:UDP-glucose 4-epimerase
MGCKNTIQGSTGLAGLAWRKVLRSSFHGKKVLILGGLGFIGSDPARVLCEFGANVLVVDAMISGYGVNLYPIVFATGDVRVNSCDIRNEAADCLVRGQGDVFHSSTRACPPQSLDGPILNVDINILRGLEWVRSEWA